MSGGAPNGVSTENMLRTADVAADGGFPNDPNEANSPLVGTDAVPLLFRDRGTGAAANSYLR